MCHSAHLSTIKCRSIRLYSYTYDRVLVATDMIVVMWQSFLKTAFANATVGVGNECTIGPVCKSFGYIEQPDITSIFLFTSVIDSNTTTRMQSSRMRTIRCSGHVLVGGVSAQEGCLARGDLVCWGRCLPRGLSDRGCLPGAGVRPGGCLSKGVSARGGCLPCEQNHRQV